MAILVRDAVLPSEAAGLPYIGLEHIGEGDLGLIGVGVAEDATSTKLRFTAGDILFGRLRPYFRKVVRPSFDGICSTDIWVVRPANGIDARFLFYLMGSDLFVEPLVRASEGTKMPRAKWEYAASLELPLPPLPEQRAIAHILGTLDDKIELNRRMSETLEQMARAIFKAWFVDFEPVRAKMEGRWRRGESLPGLPANLYDLFPDRLVDSELGEIPEGWRVGKMADILAELVTGARPKGGALDEGVPSVGAENVIGLGRYDYSKEKYVPGDFFEQLKARRADIRNGDVLLYKDGAYIGRKTYFDCDFPHPECAVNEHVYILRSKYRWMQRYLFFWLDLPWMTQEITALNSGSAQPGINQAGVRHLPLLWPPDRVIKEFDALVRPLVDDIFRNCHESRTLATLRDALLPKLIRGEIRVRDVEKPVSMWEKYGVSKKSRR
jgi:type I restriction enzyme S subunit